MSLRAGSFRQLVGDVGRTGATPWAVLRLLARQAVRLRSGAFSATSLRLSEHLIGMRLQHDLSDKKESPPAFIALGGAREIGASCGVLGIGGHRLVIDAGVRSGGSTGQTPGRPDPRLPRLEALAKLAPIDAVFVTHAHADHVNGLPVLLRGLPPDVPVFATSETAKIMAVNLHEQILLSTRGIGGPSLYSRDEVDALLARVRPLEAGNTYVLELRSGPLAVRPVRAGHILGAVMYAFEASDGQGGFWRSVHSGDYDTRDALTIQGADLEALRDFRPHLLVSEGTYGTGVHEDVEEQRTSLLARIFEVSERGGTTLLPAFAIGRAQEVGLLLKDYARNPEKYEPAWSDLPSGPPVLDVCMDGGARRVADIYDAHRRDLSPLAQSLGDREAHLFFGGHGMLRALRQRDRTALHAIRRPGRVIISPSGALRGGPSEVYARILAQNSEDAIFLTGYTDEESPGRRLLNLAERPPELRQLTLSDDGVIDVKCDFGVYRLSAHTDMEGIVDLLTILRPFVTTLVHGDTDQLRGLRTALVDRAEDGGYSRDIGIAPLGAPRGALPEGRGNPHANPFLLNTGLTAEIWAGQPAQVESSHALTLDPMFLYQACLLEGIRPYSAQQVASVALPDTIVDPGMVRLVTDELEGSVDRLFLRANVGYSIVYTPLRPAEVHAVEGHKPNTGEQIASQALWHLTRAVAAGIGDLVVVRYRGEFCRAAVLCGVEGEDGFAACVAHSTQSYVRRDHIVASLGKWPGFEQEHSRESLLAELSLMAYDPEPSNLMLIDPIKGRERLLSSLWQIYLDGGSEASYARMAAHLLVEAPELVWRGTSEHQRALFAPMDLDDVNRWLAAKGVTLLSRKNDRQVRLGPWARRLFLAGRPLPEQLRHEVRAWRRAFERERLERLGMGSPTQKRGTTAPLKGTIL